MPLVLDQKRVSISRSIEQRKRERERGRGGEEGTEVGKASPLRSTSQKWIGGGVGDGESNNSGKEKNGRKPEEETVYGGRAIRRGQGGWRAEPKM